MRKRGSFGLAASTKFTKKILSLPIRGDICLGYERRIFKGHSTDKIELFVHNPAIRLKVNAKAR
jgi:hypothetical protein